MNGHADKQTGFALLIVLLLVAMAAVVGVSYLASASVKLASSNNLVSASRAKYLAESGLQHALYLLKTNPTSVTNSTAASPLGPFYADESGDSYSFYAVSDSNTTGKYVIMASATARGVRQRSSATVFCSFTKSITVKHGVLVNDGVARFPSGLVVRGDVHTNQTLRNKGVIDGNASAVNRVWNMGSGVVTGTITNYAAPQAMPAIQWDQYRSYKLSGTSYTATELRTNTLAGSSPLCNGGVFSPSNPGGVLVLKPASGIVVRLTGDLNFSGTIVINGYLELDGANIQLTPADGFPAIIATRQVWITNRTNATINGLVVADHGISPLFLTANSQTTINGGLVSKSGAYSTDLDGRHVLNYDAKRCKVYDMSSGSGGQGDLTVGSLNE